MPTPELVFAVTDTEHRTDLLLATAPEMTFDTVTVTPVGIRITYTLTQDDEIVTVRIDGRNKHGHLDYYRMDAQHAWPEWLTALVDEHRPEPFPFEISRLRPNVQKLITGWRQSSHEHDVIACSKELLDNPSMAGRQAGRSVQYADCATELEQVLAGHDPDEWTDAVSVAATSA